MELHTLYKIDGKSTIRGIHNDSLLYCIYVNKQNARDTVFTCLVLGTAKVRMRFIELNERSTDYELLRKVVPPYTHTARIQFNSASDVCEYLNVIHACESLQLLHYTMLTNVDLLLTTKYTRRRVRA